MKYLLTILPIFFSCALSAQTFSIIVDPVEGDETLSHQNLLFDIDILNEKIFGTAQHFCNSNPSSNVNTACASLCSFSLQGEHNNSILIDTFFNGRLGGLLVDNDRIFLANYSHEDPALERSLYIHEFDTTLNLLARHLIPSIINSSMNNDGLKRIGNNYYVYGNSTYPTIARGFVQKLDLDFNLIWTKEYNHGEFINSCDKLQKTDGDNLIFAHQYNKGQTGTAGNSGLQIMKINFDGIKLDSLQLNVLTNVPIALLSDSEDMIYVYTDNHPSPSSALDLSQGSLNKYSNNLDTLVWSLGFPHNNYTDGRSYYVRTITEARNGDILVCGSVFDRELYSLFLEQENHTDNGFIARVTKDGTIRWLRIYKSPNTDSNLPREEFGEFHHSLLADMIELEDGRIIAGGSSYLTTSQLSIVVGTTEPLSQFLILAVDGMTGCIEGEECDEIIILDNQYRPRDNYLPILNSNYRWIVEQFSADDTTSTLSFTYSEDSIFQNTNHYHEQIDLETIDKPEQNILGYFRELGGRIYQKFEGNFNEKLVFDIHLQVGESIEVYRGEDNAIELQAVATDTIELLDGVPRKRILLQCLSEPISTDTIVWIEGIGELENSKFCDSEGQASLILCVQDNTGDFIYSQNESTCELSIDICENNTFEIGNSWTYEEYVLFNNNSSQEIRPFTFEIVDERMWKGRPAYVIEPGIPSDYEYMIYEDGLVYFWDELLDEYQLTYDFNNDSIYYVRYFDFNENDIDSSAVFIDSVRIEQFDGKDIQVQYCRSQFGKGNTFQEFVVYEGIGRGDRGPKFQLNLVDGFVAGNLRCFDSSDCSAKFVDFPCDTSFLMTVSTFDIKNDVKVNLFPNPVRDRLIVETDGDIQNFDFQIFNLQGQPILKGVYDGGVNVGNIPSGIYFLQIQIDKGINRYVKFVKE